MDLNNLELRVSRVEARLVAEVEEGVRSDAIDAKNNEI
jgi:hypothetical protein